MRRCVWCFLVYSWFIPIPLSTAASQPTSEGHPHKWDTVEKGMADFIADGFELKSVVYDSSESPKGEPDVHYFLQKATQLVRCDFRRRDQTSYYWCAQLTMPRKP